MLKILKKVVFVALIALFRVYETWASGGLPSAGICTASMGTTSCMAWCYNRGYAYWWVGSNGLLPCSACLCWTAADSYGKTFAPSCYGSTSPGTTSYTNKCYPGVLAATATNGIIGAIRCSHDTITCSSTTAWITILNNRAIQSRYACSAGTGSCVETLWYACQSGYWNSSPITSTTSTAITCTRCPSTYQVPMSSPVYGTTAGAAASSVTACYQPANVGGIKDSTGTYTWTNSCYSCNLSTPTCTVASNCWASGQGSGYTSCNTGGCCSNVCAQWICDPTAGATTTYGVKTQCYNHGLGSCVNNCCTNSCNGGSSAVCGTSGVTYCRTLGYNNNATCTNGCCVGAKCTSAYGSAGNLTGRCTTNANCATDTSEYDYSCNTTTGCCIRSTITSCLNGSCTVPSDCMVQVNQTASCESGCCVYSASINQCQASGSCSNGVTTGCKKGWMAGDDCILSCIAGKCVGMPGGTVIK